MMEEQLAAEEAERRREERERKKEEQEIDQNINHILAEEREEYLNSDDVLVNARSVEEALDHLGVNDTPTDKHPEKRLKAAFLAYESVQLPILRQENPSLKLSQLKELLWKQWQKAPENPLNQAKA